MHTETRRWWAALASVAQFLWWPWWTCLERRVEQRGGMPLIDLALIDDRVFVAATIALGCTIAGTIVALTYGWVGTAPAPGRRSGSPAG